MTMPRENRTSTTMAQARVTDFFSARKRTAESQPSKRRKLNIIASDIETLPTADINTRSTRSSARNKKGVDYRPENQVYENSVDAEISLPQKTKEQTKKKTKTTIKRGRTTKTQGNRFKNQINIADAFASASNFSDFANSEDVNLHEEVTSAWDEHCPHTPSKRTKDVDSSESTGVTRKRTYRGKGKLEIATPEKQVEAPKEKPKSARKKLHLNRPIIESSDSNDSENEFGKIEEKREIILQPKTPPAISPLPDTPENVRQQLKDVPTVPTSAKVRNAMDLVKKLQKAKGKQKNAGTSSQGETLKALTTADSMKQQLAKVGGIEELKARLADMSKTKASLKVPVPQLKKFDDIEVKPLESQSTKEKAGKKTAAAYERFHSLASPAPPTLCLPYHYKVLGEMFRSMDTVVSMLHNRSECCTFSKLKAAVQEMTKRNFDEKKTGQIKTVYPSAYRFSQVKGLPAFGNKTTGFQLCIDANLQDDAGSSESNAKVMFTAQHLLSRKSTFHNKLIAIVKKYHREFLSRLDRPLSIPDDKITRWHPKFQVDKVPDIEAADLPKPPEIKTYQTAKDVLKQARGKLPLKMEKALENVALKSEVKQEVQPTPTPVKTKTDDTKYKGIPQGLLEKIRAKENQKLAMSMMRNPAEDKRKEMLRRLPEMMRILRTHFVTEKKPALTMESVVQKLVDSHRSYIAPASVESHLQLMLEVLPEWLKLLQIQKGKYLKMDRSVDLQTLTDKITNMGKA